MNIKDYIKPSATRAAGSAAKAVSIRVPGEILDRYKTVAALLQQADYEMPSFQQLAALALEETIASSEKFARGLQRNAATPAEFAETAAAQY